MADDRSEDISRDELEDDGFRALAEVRSALEAVEREQAGARSERRRLRGRLDALLTALREDAVILAFDRDRELVDASGAVGDHFEISGADLVSDFEDFADEETIEALDEANRTVMEGDASAACVSDGFLKAGDEELATTFVHIARTDADGEVVGIEAIGIIAPAPEVEDDEVEEDSADPFEALLENVARRLLGDPSDAGIARAVRSFGDFIGADRVVVNRYDEAHRSFSVMASWLRPGTDPLPAEERGISISEFPWAYSALGAGESITISDDADLPSEARREKELYAGEDVASSLLVPILRHDTLAGFVSVQSATAGHGWKETDAARARLFGVILTAGLAQAEAENALTQAREEAALAAAARADAENALTDARQELQRVEDDRNATRREIETLERREKTLREQLDRAGQDAERLRRELDDAREDESSTRSRLERLQEDADRARRRAEDAAADALTARDELEELRRRLADSEREIVDLRARAEEPGATARGLSAVGDPTPAAEEEDAPSSGWHFGDHAPAGDSQEEEDRAADGATDGDETADDEESDADWKTTRRPEVGGKGLDPDATIEVATAARFGFDPDATIEMDPTRPGTTTSDDAGDDHAPDSAVEPEELDVDGHDASSDDAPGAFEPTQSASSDEDPAGPGKWKRDKASWEDSTDEVPLPKFFGGKKSLEDGDGVDLADDAVDDDFADRFTAKQAEPLEADRSSARPWWRRDGDEGDDGIGEGDAAADTTEDAGETDEKEIVSERYPAAASSAAGWDDPLQDDAGDLDDADGLPTLPGVEVENGLAEVGGNVELYRNLLTKFRDDYVGAADKIAAAIEKGNIEVAHLLLHAVKGVAGVLGAERVRTNADELETRLIGGDPDATRSAVAGFTDALHEVLDSIAMLDGNTFAQLPETAPLEAVSGDFEEGEESDRDDLDDIDAADETSSPAADPTVLRSYLRGLRPHLTARKPRQCMLVMREVTSRDWPDDYSERVAELADLIEDGDFETASDSYYELMERLDRA